MSNPRGKKISQFCCNPIACLLQLRIIIASSYKKGACGVRKGPFILCAAGAVLLVSYAILLCMPLSGGEDAQATPPPVSAPPTSVAQEQEAHSLFSSLAREDVAELRVQTPEQRYIFRCPDALRVSVNGQKADLGVFETLLEQVLSLPVVTISAFTPSTQACVTLELTADGTRYTASFYRGAREDDPYVSVVSSRPGADVRYHRTDSWRLGTMLLACEGTRILDEKGDETPFTE